MKQEIKTRYLTNPQKKCFFAVIVSVIAASLVVGVIACLVLISTLNKITKQQEIIISKKNSTKTLVIDKVSEGEIIASEDSSVKINSKDYSLVNYSLQQSPVYKQIDKICLDPFYSDAEDARLVKNKTEIIIPSLIQLVSPFEKNGLECFMHIDIFSSPANEKYLYLRTYYTLDSDAPNTRLSGLYKLDLSDLSIKRLAISEFVSEVDLYRNQAMDSYILLYGGKKLIKWNTSGIYLIELESDSKTALYELSQDQWLVSKISESGLGQFAQYNIRIDGDQITFGVYEKYKTNGGDSIEAVLKSRRLDYGESIIPDFIKHVTIEIPS